MDDNIDENEINERVHLNSILRLHILTILFMEAIYFVVSCVASFFPWEFYVVNPICLLISIEVGWLTFKRFTPVHRQREFRQILVTIVLIAAILQALIQPADSLSFTLRLLRMACAIFLFTFALLASLALFWM